VGTKTSGTYADTTAIDGNFESYMESNVGSGNFTFVDNQSFEENWTPNDWTATGNWNQESNYSDDRDYSADFDGEQGGVSGYLYSPVMNCSNADEIYVQFWWQDRALDNGDFLLEYFNGAAWNVIEDLNQVESGNGGHIYSEIVTDIQYFVSTFQVRWYASNMFSGETACVDSVTIKKGVTGQIYSLDLTGEIPIDLSAYQEVNIQSLELQVMFRANDSSETWYLQAYNWTSSTYSDNGFNITVGHVPTTGWDYYTVDFADGWQSYLNSGGTVNVRFVDQGADDEQTSVDIDFLGINVKTDGTQLTFENEGSLTVHLVSLWVTNSTHHERYDIDVFLNSGATKNYVSYDIELPTENYIVKAVTERGNTAVFSEN
jgi:hypothetical protein